MEAAVQSLKKGKSAGVDNIPAELVQAGGQDVIAALTRICNNIWQTGEWPTPWTQSLVPAVVWSCLPFIRSGQNHLARHSESGKKTRQTEEEMGRQYQGMDRPGVRQVPAGSGEQGKMEKTGCKIIFGAPTTLAVKG